ncbi:MAG: TerB family tellurite resistance protein [Myxococcales bacterium]|jgi:uncharacterized tellurite resistance protein B-like protein
MIWLSNSTLTRLRDKLRASGQRPSLFLTDPTAISPEATELLATTAEYGPLSEAMYLMMSADGHVTHDERQVLRGALRNLSDGSVRSVTIEALLDAAARNVASHGREKRLLDVSQQLAEDPNRAEVAFVLAAAMALADNVVADEENDLLNRFAELLGIDEVKANALLDALENDLTDAR